MAEKIVFISEGYYFFQTLVLYLVLLAVKSCSALQAIPHSSQPVFKVGGKTYYLQNLINKLLFNCSFHRKNSVCCAKSLLIYFVKKAAEMLVAYSELLPEANALLFHSYNFGMV